MAALKTASKVTKIEGFVLCLCTVLVMMDLLEVKLLSWTGILILVGSSIFLLLIARIVPARKAITRTQALQMTGLLFFLGLGLLYSPITMLQMAALDSFNIASLMLGITLSY